MGRFSSVQAYADNNTNVRKVAYEQVAGTSTATSSSSGNQRETKGLVKPEKVVNAYGSTAGAGSGEFHVYRHARAREIERIQQLEAIDDEQIKDMTYQQKIQQNQIEEEERTAKRRKKRQRQKESKQRKTNLKKAGIAINTSNDNESDSNNDDDDEFVYIPVNKNMDNNNNPTTISSELPNNSLQTVAVVEQATTTTEVLENDSNHKLVVVGEDTSFPSNEIMEKKKSAVKESDN